MDTSEDAHVSIGNFRSRSKCTPCLPQGGAEGEQSQEFLICLIKLYFATKNSR